MSTQAPSFPLNKLTTETDRGVTNAVDGAYVLGLLFPGNSVVTSKNRVGYTLSEERSFLSSKNAVEPKGLIGRFDDGHRINFIITVAPRKGVNKSELKTLHIYFTFPILGTIRVRSTSNLVDAKGNGNVINFSFGPYLDGSAKVEFLAKDATVTYQYTAVGRKVNETSASVNLLPLELPPFSS